MPENITIPDSTIFIIFNVEYNSDVPSYADFSVPNYFLCHR
jgi:hypothetical protein